MARLRSFFSFTPPEGVTDVKRPKSLALMWQNVGPRFLPFADAASAELPLPRLLRLALFQVSIAIAAVLLTGTLNRVMIVELGVATSLVALVIAIPVLAAPARLLIGHRSDNHNSLIGWRRVPYMWIGAMLQFGGLSIMPFAMLVLQSQTTGPEWAGPVGAMLAFLLTGSGMHMTQTAGLALAADLSTEDTRPRVVALMYVVLLIGMVVSALVFGWLLDDFSSLRLIQVIQGAALISLIFTVASFWKQEGRNRELTRPDREKLSLAEALEAYRRDPTFQRLMLSVGLGAMAFAMQDVLLEPYGGEVLGLSVSATTLLTAIWASGAVIGFAVAARLLTLGRDMHGVAALGMLIGIVGLSAVVFAEPLALPHLFRAGTALIGLGSGLFGVGTMLAAMRLAEHRNNGLAIGAWSAVQTTAIGLGLAAGGFVRDGVNLLVDPSGHGALVAPAAGYGVVYHIEIGLLFAGLIAIGPLVGRDHSPSTPMLRRVGLADLPG